MKVALIPPLGYEKYALRSSIHLTLPIPTCALNKAYMSAYESARTNGDYIIMDNGAAEDSMIDNFDIIRFASTFVADEIVLPDVIGNRDRTVGAVDRFLIWMRNERVERTFKCMAVLHATSVRTAANTAGYYFRHAPEITVLGLPRSLGKAIGPSARIDVATQVEKLYGPRFEIHFLGANPEWIKELYFAAKYVPFVRSMDTSAPFNYTIAGERMRTGKTIARPKNYFEARRNLKEDLLEDNLQTVMEWSNAEKASVS